MNIWRGELVRTGGVAVASGVDGGLEKRRPYLDSHKICRVCRRFYWSYIELYTDSVCTLVYQLASRGSDSPRFC